MFHHILEYINPDFIIKAFGVIWVLVAIFAETWVLLGILFPWDSLLFLSGVLVSNHFLSVNIYIFILLCIFASVLWNQVWYFTWQKLWNNIYKIPENFIFKKSYLDEAKKFYDKYGKMAIIFWRFVPIVRTLVPIFAGAFGVKFTDFLIYNILWWVLRICLFVGGWFILWNKFPQIWNRVDLVWIIIVIISIIPIIYKYLSNKYFKKNK